jgi:signal transduction histidine kinase
VGHAEPFLSSERGRTADARGNRRLPYWLTRPVVVAAIFSAAATAMVVVVPPLHFAYELPELHVAIETAAALIGLLAAYLVFGRYRRSRNLADFALCYSLGLLAVSNLVFAVLPAIVNSQPDRFGTWARICGALLGSAILAFAAFARPRRIRLGRGRLAAAMASIPAVLLLVAGVVFALGSRLPAGVELAPLSQDASRPHIDGNGAVLAAQLVGMALLVLAAVGFALKAQRSKDELLRWLAVAAVFGAFARLNYFLYPSAYTDWVYFGDFFRLAFYVAILFAAVQEIRSYWETVSATAVLEERRRIARDLHDGLAQELAFIGRNLRSLDGDDPTVARVSASAARALSESRLAIAALTKPLNEPLEIALAQAARDTANREGTDIDLILSPGIELDYRRRDALIRIACEAISNAARHGGASLVRVELQNGRQVHLHVSDDGRGFDPESLTPGREGGFGLTSMRERAHAFGGAFEVRSRPGGGTQVDVAL